MKANKIVVRPFCNPLKLGGYVLPPNMESRVVTPFASAFGCRLPYAVVPALIVLDLLANLGHHGLRGDRLGVVAVERVFNNSKRARWVKLHFSHDSTRLFRPGAERRSYSRNSGLRGQLLGKHGRFDLHGSDQPGIPKRVQVRSPAEGLKLIAVATAVVTESSVKGLMDVAEEMHQVFQRAKPQLGVGVGPKDGHLALDGANDAIPARTVALC